MRTLDRIDAARAPVPVTVVDELGDGLSGDVEAGLYFRVAGGANVAKRAHPTEVFVHIGRRNGSAYVEIRDDGVGGLSDRFSTVPRASRIASRRGGGTTLVAEVPLRSAPIGDGARRGLRLA